MKKYLVYEHWRPDLGVCFYVGKGKRKRAFSYRRNSRYDRTVHKLERNGLSVEVRIIAEFDSEKDAFDLEIERIAYWRGQHRHLTNQTDGGDGSSGYNFLPEQREKIRQKALHRKMSPETKARLSEIRSNWKWSEKTKSKMRTTALIVQGPARKRYCQTPAGKRQMLRMSRKAARSPTVRAKRSLNATNLWKDPVYRSNVMAARAASRCVADAVIEGLT